MAFARFSTMQRPEACLIGWMREALQRMEVGTEPSGDGFRPGEAAVWWRGMFRLAAAHGVAGVVWPVVGRLSGAAAPPREVRLAWACHVQRLENRWLMQRTAVGRLAALSREEGLPMLLLKGYGLSLLYPEPALRPCGDVDVWFFGRRREADRCLAARFGAPVRAFDGHHTTFRVGSVTVENHGALFDPRTHASNARLEPLFERLAASDRATVDVGGESVSLPPPQFEALYLLRHAAVHFAGAGFGLRHLADWRQFIACRGGQVDWSLLAEQSGILKMGAFLDCLDALCVDHLGLDAAAVPRPARDEELEGRVLEEILQRPDVSLPPLPGRLLRWWRSRWKHRLAYDEPLLSAFLRSAWAHAVVRSAKD